MLIQVPIGRHSAPNYAIVDTTAAAIEPKPFAPRVVPFHGDGCVRLRPDASWVSRANIEKEAARLRMPIEEARGIEAAQLEEDRKEWRTRAAAALDESYSNALIHTPGDVRIYTHATVAEIRVAIFDAYAKGEPIATVMHRYDPLPEFDERGLPPEAPQPDNETPL